MNYAVMALTLGLVLLALDTAQACGRMQLGDVENRHWQGKSGSGYDPFDPVSYTQTVKLSVHKRGPADCNYFLVFSTGRTGSFDRQLTGGAGGLAYNLYRNANLSRVVKDLPTAKASDVIFGSFPAAGKQTNGHSVHFHIPPRQAVAAGIYHDRLTLTLYRGDLQDFTPEDRMEVRFLAKVPRIANLSIVESSAPFGAAALERLDLGELEKGAEFAFDLLLRSNADYEMTLQSDNGNILFRDGSAGGPLDRVPYRLQIGGAAIDLSGGHAVPFPRAGGSGTPGVERLSGRVTVGRVGNATAGIYRDAITVVVTAR